MGVIDTSAVDPLLLERARRMESLGVLAGGVAHDLNNLLGPMMAYPDLILMDLPAESPLCEDVRQIKVAAQRAATMVQDLLTLARRGVYRMGSLNLNKVVHDYLRSPPFAEQPGPRRGRGPATHRGRCPPCRAPEPGRTGPSSPRRMRRAVHAVPLLSRPASRRGRPMTATANLAATDPAAEQPPSART